jgi:hypothetical protein
MKNVIMSYDLGDTQTEVVMTYVKLLGGTEENHRNPQ